jgi:hypothetical protein
MNGSTVLGLLAEVPPAPAPPHAALIQHLSVLFTVMGIGVVLFLIKPVRNACRDLSYTVMDLVQRRPTAPAKDETETPVDTVETPASRREIEEFDLDIFN